MLIEILSQENEIVQILVTHKEITLEEPNIITTIKEEAIYISK